VDAKESSVFRLSEASEDHHPHACTDGLVFLTYTVFDEAVGEEVERLEVLPRTPSSEPQDSLCISCQEIPPASVMIPFRYHIAPPDSTR
jgi:hypothetical protein